MPYSYDDFIEDHSEAQKTRDRHETTWQKIEDALERYASKGDVYSGIREKTSTDTLNMRIESSFCLSLISRAAASLTTFILPVKETGISLSSLTQEPTGELKSWMDKAEKKLVRYMLESDGRIYREVQAAIKEAYLYGNGAVQVAFLEGSAVPHFISMPIMELYIKVSDKTNEVYTILRKSRGKKHDIFKQDEVAEIWFLKDGYNPLRAKPTDPKTWGVVYKRWENGELAEDQLLSSFPLAYGRLLARPGEVYGEGFGREIIQDVNRYYKAWEHFMNAVEAQVTPAMNVRRSAFLDGKFSLTPGKINNLKGGALSNVPPSQPVVQVVELNSTIKFLEMLSELLQFATLSDILQLPEISGMTISEVVSRVENKLQILVPIVAGLQQELVHTTARRILHRMAEVGVIPPPPGEFNLSEVDFTFTTRFDHMRRLSDVAQSMAFVQNITAIASINPEAVDSINFDKLVEHIAESTLLPRAILRDPREVEEIRAQRQQQMAAMQMAEQQQQGGTQ